MLILNHTSLIFLRCMPMIMMFYPFPYIAGSNLLIENFYMFVHEAYYVCRFLVVSLSGFDIRGNAGLIKWVESILHLPLSWRDHRELVSFFLKCLVKFASKTIWAWRLEGRFVAIHLINLFILHIEHFKIYFFTLGEFR